MQRNSDRRSMRKVSESSVEGDDMESREPRTVNLTDIKRMTVSTVYGQRFLNVYHSGGKLTIGQSLLPDPAAFDQLCSTLARRAPASASRG
jgi:hypothetical protein